MEVYDAMVQPPDDSTSGQPKFPVPDPTGNANDVLTTDGVNLLWALIKDANIDPAAAIAVSKLASPGPGFTLSSTPFPGASWRDLFDARFQAATGATALAVANTPLTGLTISKTISGSNGHFAAIAVVEIDITVVGSTAFRCNIRANGAGTGTTGAAGFDVVANTPYHIIAIAGGPIAAAAYTFDVVARKTAAGGTSTAGANSALLLITYDP